MKELSTNELIPQLIDKFSSHANKLRDRVKINSFFAEFNQTARNQLNQFIKMSQNRYKGVKSGNSLENILLHQKPEYTKISNQILSDQFYSTNDIEVENKKLFKKTKKKDNDEINELRNKIKTGAKDFSKAEILRHVWGGDADDGIVNVYVHYLREKLEAGTEKIILSSRGNGYKINEKFLDSEGDLQC